MERCQELLILADLKFDNEVIPYDAKCDEHVVDFPPTLELVNEQDGEEHECISSNEYDDVLYTDEEDMHADKNFEFCFDGMCMAIDNGIFYENHNDEEASAIDLCGYASFDEDEQCIKYSHVDKKSNLGMQSDYNDKSRMHAYVDLWENEDGCLSCIQVVDAKSTEGDLECQDDSSNQHCKLQLPDEIAYDSFSSLDEGLHDFFDLQGGSF